MTGQLYYPLADKITQRFDDDYAGIRWEGPAEKGCIHTTETTTWPGYGGGKSAPTLTVKPNFTLRRLDWRQHFPANMSVRALQNDTGGVETNRDKVIQVEIVGTCDGRPKSRSLPNGGAHVQWEEKGIPHLYTAEAPGWFFEHMAKFFVWCYEEQGISLIEPGLWLPYDASYGNSRARMSGKTFNNYRGWLGHMHVAENDHGDPGSLDVKNIIAIAKKSLVPIHPETNSQDLDMFIAAVPGEVDKRVFLVGVEGKRLIPNPKVLASLKKAGIPDVGEMPSEALSMFPTLEENGTEGGTTMIKSQATLDGVKELLRRTPEAS